MGGEEAEDGLAKSGAMTSRAFRYPLHIWVEALPAFQEPTQGHG
jgi:hypothetical protein